MKFSHYMEAPDFKVTPRPWLFTAGGITSCPDWQTEAKKLLVMPESLLPEWKGGTIWNPRRANFDITQQDIAKEQIEWEYHMLDAADAILFWFCADQIQPITLLELGRWSAKSLIEKPLFVGVDPKYPRKMDVEVQMELARPGMPIYQTLDALCAAVLAFPFNP